MERACRVDLYCLALLELRERLLWEVAQGYGTHPQGQSAHSSLPTKASMARQLPHLPGRPMGTFSQPLTLMARYRSGKHNSLASWQYGEIRHSIERT